MIGPTKYTFLYLSLNNIIHLILTNGDILTHNIWKITFPCCTTKKEMRSFFLDKNKNSHLKVNIKY